MHLCYIDFFSMNLGGLEVLSFRPEDDCSSETKNYGNGNPHMCFLVWSWDIETLDEKPGMVVKHIWLITVFNCYLMFCGCVFFVCLSYPWNINLRINPTTWKREMKTWEKSNVLPYRHIQNDLQELLCGPSAQFLHQQSFSSY